MRAKRVTLDELNAYTSAGCKLAEIILLDGKNYAVVYRFDDTAEVLRA